MAMAIVFVILGAIALAGGLFFLIKTLRTFIKDTHHNELDKAQRRLLILTFLAIAVAGGFLQASINLFCSWSMSNLEAIFSVAGAALFFLSNASLWSSFYLHYWKPQAEERQAKWFRNLMFASIPLVLIFFLLLGEGVANHLTYPLVSGFVISGQGWTWVNFHNWQSVQSSTHGLHIAFYGIIMVFSAVVVYWVCDHEFYKEFHKHGILDAALLICFPAGIIGGRIGYVIGNWNGDGAGGPNFSSDWANGRWYTIFQIWNGGLTILGGALGGIIAGAIFFMRHRKYVNVRWAADIIVPAILIAQAIGRWGNFFNHEVYGGVTSMSDWSFLPTWLRLQMGVYVKKSGVLSTTDMQVPLFLIESIINLIGYFVLKYAIGKPLRKYLAKGDLAAGYLIWYGITRLIMEPMRDPTFKMGSNGKWSIIWSIVYIGLGVLLVIFFHVLDYILAKKKRTKEESQLDVVPPIVIATPEASKEAPKEVTPEQPTSNVGEDKPIPTKDK
jgi:phosphatidylglycerol:prolipoprotein diacylglycerol transferase